MVGLKQMKCIKGTLLRYLSLFSVLFIYRVDRNRGSQPDNLTLITRKRSPVKFSLLFFHFENCSLQPIFQPLPSAEDRVYRETQPTDMCNNYLTRLKLFDSSEFRSTDLCDYGSPSSY